MLQDLFDHETAVKKILDKDPKNHDWKREYDTHLLCLYHLQRERLIHLLVTLTVALATVGICITLIIVPSLLLGILALMLMCLLVPYLLHYQKLENTTQRWYKLNQEIKQKII